MSLLSNTEEYALRAMSALAALEPGESRRAHDLAETTDIPVYYLSKVMRRLVVAKLVRGRKGHGGGFTLNRAPKEITFHDILAAVGSGMPSACAFGWASCDEKQPCPLHFAWSDLKSSFEHWSRRTTLADIRAGSIDSPRRRRAPE